MLVGLVRRQRAHGGDVVVQNATPQVAKVFALTQLTTVFKVNQPLLPALGVGAPRVPPQNTRTADTDQAT